MSRVIIRQVDLVCRMTLDLPLLQMSELAFAVTKNVDLFHLNKLDAVTVHADYSSYRYCGVMVLAYSEFLLGYS